MTVRLDFLAMLPLVLVSACTSTAAVKEDNAATLVDRHIVDAARRIELAQGDLFRSIGEVTPVARNHIGGPLVSVVWRGDASQLLARLAKDRGLSFTPMGVRLPLPVSINVNGETLEQVLDRIRSQVGYRAVVEAKPESLVLLYNRPTP